MYPSLPSCLRVRYTMIEFKRAETAGKKVYLHHEASNKIFVYVFFTLIWCFPVIHLPQSCRFLFHFFIQKSFALCCHLLFEILTCSIAQGQQRSFLHLSPASEYLTFLFSLSIKFEMTMVMDHSAIFFANQLIMYYYFFTPAVFLKIFFFSLT